MGFVIFVLVAVAVTIGAVFVLGSLGSKHESAPFGCLFGVGLMLVGAFIAAMYQDSHRPESIERNRRNAARATIAAATAAVTDATAESELLALERAAATVAAAVNGGGE